MKLQKGDNICSKYIVLGSYRSNFLSRESLTASQKEAKETLKKKSGRRAKNRGEIGKHYVLIKANLLPPPPFSLPPSNVITASWPAHHKPPPPLHTPPPTLILPIAGF
jgi:hypothetical protein